MRMFYKDLQKNVTKILKDSKLIYSQINGSWYIWVDFRNYKNKLLQHQIISSNDLMMKLINQIGLVTVSGEAFGSKHLALRISLIDKKIIIGLKLLLSWLNN